MLTRRNEGPAHDTPAGAGASLLRASLLPGHSSVQGVGLSTERELRVDGLARCTCTENRMTLNLSHRAHWPSSVLMAAGGTRTNAVTHCCR